MGSNVRVANSDELKKIIHGIGDACHVISDVSGGLTFSELPEVLTLVSEVKDVLRDGGLAIPEWESLDDAGRAELEAFAVSEIQLPLNVTAQQYVQKVLKAAVALSAVFQAIAQ